MGVSIQTVGKCKQRTCTLFVVFDDDVVKCKVWHLAAAVAVMAGLGVDDLMLQVSGHSHDDKVQGGVG